MISAVVLTHNDEIILPRCLEGLRWCDEVIVIDDNSTDGTVNVAKKLGVKVCFHPLNDDFAGQRNFGLAQAGGEWVLFVDSDEVVTPHLAGEIRKAVKTVKKGFYIKRKDWIFGRWLTHGETANVRLLRLARKDSGKWVQPVHEVWRVEGMVGELTTPLLHYPHNNVAQFLEEINWYSGVYAQYLHARGIQEPAWQMVAKPVSKFFINYVWRLGFLDGTAGIVVALMMSFHSFLVRGKLRKL